MADNAFKYIAYTAIVGVSIIGAPRLCVTVMATPRVPEGLILRPFNDQRYVAHTIFRFNAPKKSAYNMIITALRTNKIVPSDGFNFPYNPSDKFYTKLPIEKLNVIVAVLNHVISGISIDENMQPKYTVCEVPREDREAALRAELDQMTRLDKSCIVLLKQKDCKMYKF